MYVYYMMCLSDCYLFFFFKQKTAYEMRISDWSSDVCSSDLLAAGTKIKQKHNIPVGIGLSADLDTAMATRTLLFAFGGSVQNEQGVVVQIGRASCRERVCQYV